MLLFPEDPVAAAPKILDRSAQIFPQQSGGFVVGPMAELGWGSQAGFVKANLGIVLALPDPQASSSSARCRSAYPRPTSIRACASSTCAPRSSASSRPITSAHLSLANSKIAAITVLGRHRPADPLERRRGFALSVGGFFPKYTPPPELADLQRIASQLSPPVAWLKCAPKPTSRSPATPCSSAASVRFSADLGVGRGKAWLGVDALFQWSPRFYFIFLVDAGIEIKAFGETVAGVTFHGELSGMQPWHLEGHARPTILFWDVERRHRADRMGRRDTSTAPAVSPAGGRGRSARRDDERGRRNCPPAPTRWRASSRTTPRRCSCIRSASLEVKQLSRPARDRDRSHRLEPGDVAPRESRQSQGRRHRRRRGVACDGPVRARPLHQHAQDEQASSPTSRSFRAACGSSREPARASAPRVGDYAWEHRLSARGVRAAITALWQLPSARRVSRSRTDAVAQAARMRGNPYCCRRRQRRVGAVTVEPRGEWRSGAWTTGARSPAPAEAMTRHRAQRFCDELAASARQRDGMVRPRVVLA